MSEPLRSGSEHTVELERTEGPGQRSAAAGPELDVAFLQKPFTPDVLGRKIREVLDK